MSLRVAGLTLVSLCLAGGCAEWAEERPEDVEPWRTRGLRIHLVVDGPEFDTDKLARCRALMEQRYGVIIERSAARTIHLFLGSPNWVTVSHARWGWIHQPRPFWRMSELCRDALALAVRQLGWGPRGLHPWSPPAPLPASQVAQAAPLPSEERPPAPAPDAGAPTPPPETTAIETPPPPPAALPAQRQPEPIAAATSPAPEPQQPPDRPASRPQRRARPTSERQLLPAGAATHVAQAEALYARARLRPAAAEWLVAYDLDGDPVHLLHAGYALHQLGRADRDPRSLEVARDLYRRFLDAVPNSEWASLWDEVTRELAAYEPADP